MQNSSQRLSGMRRLGSTKTPAGCERQLECAALARGMVKDGRTVSSEDFDVSKTSSHYPFETPLW